MSPTAAMPMDGGTTPAGAAASFVAMWAVMMVVMMLPSVAPTLWRFHRALVAAGAPRPGGRAALMGVGYFVVWIAIGLAVFSLGGALAAVESRLPALARAGPLTVGAVVMLAGAIELSAWKARHLTRSREAWTSGRSVRMDAVSAWLHGARLGVHCTLSCAAPMAILLVVGGMNPLAMAAVTLAISAERLAPDGVRVARAIGGLVVGVGLLLVVRAVGGA